jgi:hypothetical protein
MVEWILVALLALPLIAFLPFVVALIRLWAESLVKAIKGEFP